LSNICWLDLEMTGLDPEVERIIEIATIVTDYDLNIIDVGPNLVIKQSEELINSMDNWNTEQHNKSGLVQDVRNSIISERDAELETLEFLKKYMKPGESPLCGNTISQDRRFLIKYMPDLAKFFHYRNLDVTSLKLLVNMWRPDLILNNSKNAKHRALDDVRDSINELSYYRDNFLQ
jgi:oligoribonuclease